MNSRIEIIYNAYQAIDFEFNSGNKQLTFTITAPSVAPTQGARYKLNGVVFTVTSITGTTVLRCSSNTDKDPTVLTGTLTKLSGTGDATLTFSAWTSDNNIDLTNVDLTLVVRKNELATVNLASFTWSTHIDATLGISQLVLSQAQSSLVAPGSYMWQIHIDPTATEPSKSYFGEYLVNRSF